MLNDNTNAGPDHGYAWVVLFGSCMTRLLVEGFMSSIGILLVEWTQYFGTSTTMALIPALNLALIFTTGKLNSIQILTAYDWDSIQILTAYNMSGIVYKY